MSDVEFKSLILDLPQAPTPGLNRQFRESVDALATLCRSQNRDLAAIEGLRREALGGRIPTSPSTTGMRVWFSVACDLASQGWAIETQNGRVSMAPPMADLTNPQAEKERVRNGHLIERDRYLKEDATQRFVREMESTRLHKGAWHSIFSLMRDGRSLATQLAHAGSLSDGDDPLRSVIAPYLQFAETDAVCEYTGLKLLDIWRYFRLTWSTVPQSIPGRRMLILVRDAAAENHPVIGIAALGSAVVQLSVRDKWIRWHSDEFINDLLGSPTNENAAWLLEAVSDAINDIYRHDLVRSGLVSARDIAKPQASVIAALRAEAKRARAAHVRYDKKQEHKGASVRPAQTDWRKQAKTYLFRSKRCLALASALEVRLILSELGMERASKQELTQVLANAKGRRAVAAALRYVKAKHVGIDMADITVCGSVAPYTHLLGGKLVALLLMSPEVVHAYRRRYSKSPSLIASAMKGELVQRRPNLVFLGTTSLYGVSSSQYNRLVIPNGSLPDLDGELRYVELGRSLGFGSYHFSKTTVEEMNILTQQRRGGRRINNIFGEGVNPKLRRLREALEAIGLPPDRLLRHGSPRLVYGVGLASNFRDVLVGKAQRPRYLFRPENPADGTEAIARYWRERWLTNRIKSADVLTAVTAHSTLRPIRHSARVTQFGEDSGLPLFS